MSENLPCNYRTIDTVPIDLKILDLINFLLISNFLPMKMKDY